MKDASELRTLDIGTIVQGSLSASLILNEVPSSPAALLQVAVACMEYATSCLKAANADRATTMELFETLLDEGNLDSPESVALAARLIGAEVETREGRIMLVARMSKRDALNPSN